MFQAEADGYDLNCGESFSHVAWRDVLKVTERPSYFLIHPNGFEARVLPRRGFHHSEEIPIFRDILRSSLGTRARLISTSLADFVYCSATGRGAAGTSLLVRVKRRLVVNSDLLPWLDVAQRDEENMAVEDFHVAVGPARMVDVVSAVSTFAAVQAPTIVDGTNT